MTADPNYVQVLKNMKDKALRLAYLNGDWDIYPGQFFHSWNRDVIIEPSFRIPIDWPLYGALDYGESNPTSFGLYTVDYDGCVHRILGYYQADRAASQHAEAILELIRNCPFTEGRRPHYIYADPSMWTKRRVSELHAKSASDEFLERGLFITRANNDRVSGWRICQDALIHDNFRVFDGWNDAFLRTVPSLPRDDRNPEDIDTHTEDHAADEWRYGMIHMYRPYKYDEIPTNRGTFNEIVEPLTRPNKYGRYGKRKMADA